MNHCHAAIAASLLPCFTGECRNIKRLCVVDAMRPGAPAPLSLVSAAKMVSADAQLVRAGQGKKIHPDQKTRSSIGLVRVVRVVRAKPSTPRTCARTRACEYRFLFYYFFFSIKESTLTTLTKPMTVGIFALTKHPDQA